jgi:hypothetical protein
MNSLRMDLSLLMILVTVVDPFRAVILLFLKLWLHPPLSQIVVASSSHSVWVFSFFVLLGALRFAQE